MRERTARRATVVSAIKYPSLYARLEQTVADGKVRQRVVCTATQRELGFIWWTSTGKQVTWHFLTVGAHDGRSETSGPRNTERNAVLALRECANDERARTGGKPLVVALPFDDPTDSARVERADYVARKRATPAPVVETAPARRVVWGDSASAIPDLTAAIADALRKHQK